MYHSEAFAPLRWYLGYYPRFDRKEVLVQSVQHVECF